MPSHAASTLWCQTFHAGKRSAWRPEAWILTSVLWSNGRSVLFQATSQWAAGVPRAAG